MTKFKLKLPPVKYHTTLIQIVVFSGIFFVVLFCLYNYGKLWNNSRYNSIQRLPNLPKPKNGWQTTSQEKAFPIAFSIVVYTDFDRFTRLLRTIYREHNVYCIHVDVKAEKEFVDKAKQLVRSMGRNVFMLPDNDRVNVKWGRVTVLLADITCAQYLLARHQTWKYWINLTGHEFPLRTNWEMVTALTALSGYNLIAAHVGIKSSRRYPPKHYLSFKIKWMKGSTLIVAQRAFVEYMLTNSRSIEILKALKRHEATIGSKIIADESYYGTLSHNPEVMPAPGACRKEPSSQYHQMVRYVIWNDVDRFCGSNKWRHSVCMLGLRDLPTLMKMPNLFANKFIPSVEPEAYDLLEAWISMKVSYESKYGKQHPSFNLTFYDERRSIYEALGCI